MSGTLFAERLAASFADIDLVFPQHVELPDHDELPDTDFEPITADGQTFAIAYIDSSGRSSLRRITVWSIGRGKGDTFMLKCFCHERKANRSFRMDRIQHCISMDGELFDDVPSFLAETFGLHESRFRTTGPASELWSSIIATVRPDAVLLAAMARSDGHFHSKEVDAAEDYLLRRAESTGVMLDASMCAALIRYYRGLRPTSHQIESAMERLSQREPNETMNFLVAAAEVMRADGRKTHEELALLDAMAIHLTGLPVVQ